MTARPTYTAAHSRVQERGPYAEPDRGDAAAMWGAVFAATIAVWSSILTLLCMWAL